MGVRILTDTTDIPITMIGELSGLCWGSDTKDHKKNYKRGLSCIKSNHGRTLEFPQIYMELTGYSARVVREIYTHTAGSPTRLQESTRYVDSTDFGYIVPPKIKDNPEALFVYGETMRMISDSIQILERDYGIKREDSAMLLPLGMETKVVIRTNLRHIIDMSHQRLCTRAYWEFKKFMKDLLDALAFYSDEWNYLVKELKLFVPKCQVLGYCPEEHSCHAAMSKEERDMRLNAPDSLFLMQEQGEEYYE